MLRHTRPNNANWTNAEITSYGRLASLVDVPLVLAARNVVPVAVTAGGGAGAGAAIGSLIREVDAAGCRDPSAPARVTAVYVEIGPASTSFVTAGHAI